MLKKNKWLVVVLGIIVAGFLIWYFSRIVLYILIAAVFSIMGRPLMLLLDKIKIGKRKFPHTLSALITLTAIYAVVGGFFALVVPLLVSQIVKLSSLDPNLFIDNIQEPLSVAQNFLVKYHILQPDQNISVLISDKVMSFLSIGDIGETTNVLINFAGSFFIAVFAVAFITFFFLKQDRMLLNGIMLLTPVDYQTEIKLIYYKIIKLLSRYFLGLSLDLFIVISVITLSMFLWGFKNALIIGFFAGIMNVVPYIGPFIGWILALILATTGVVESGEELMLLPVFLKVSGTLLVVNLLDAFILQPTIYSNVVKAHPLEIFLVILTAGSIAGIPGMILAIPTYTVIRIIAKEFFIKYPVIKKITKNI